MVVPSLVCLCILALGPYADQLHAVEWSTIPLNPAVALELSGIDVDTWTVLIHLFTNIPPALCSFTTAALPSYAHGFLTVLSLPSSNHLTFSLLRSTPNLAALDASSTALSSLPSNLLHLRVLYLRNCKQITDHIFPSLLSFPLLSVIDLTGTKCSLTDPLFPFAPSTISDLFQPSIQASLAALASLYPNNATFPSPLYTLTYLLPRPAKPTPRIGTQDSFVVFSSSSTKIGNTNTLIYDEEHPHRSLERHSFPISRPSLFPPFNPLPLPLNPLAAHPNPRSFPPPIATIPFFRRPTSLDGSRPRLAPTPTSSPFHLHRPPPSCLHQHSTTTDTTAKPKPKLPSPSITPASLNLQNHKAHLARKGIQAFIKLRSTPSSQNPAMTPNTLNPETPSEFTSCPLTSSSKNPFKRPTPLKPISSFPLPILSPSLLPKEAPLPRKKPKITSESPPPSKPPTNLRPNSKSTKGDLNRTRTKSFDWKTWSSSGSGST